MALFDDSATTWRIEPSALTPALQDIWADTIVDLIVRDQARGFMWSFQMSSGSAEAYLHTDGTCLYIDAALAEAAQIACLFRHYVPGPIEVTFCDQGYTSDLAIAPKTTPAELIGRWTPGRRRLRADMPDGGQGPGAEYRTLQRDGACLSVAGAMLSV